MIDVENIYNDPCKKIDPWCIDAYFDLKLTPSDSTELTLDNSWNTTSVDLLPAIKAGETITHLFLTPTDNPTALQYNREDYGRKGAENGGVDCISGDALSRIISMKYLKDVSQTKAPTNGDVYMYDGNLFQPYNLQTFITNTNNTLKQHTQAIDQLNTGLTNLQRVVENNYTALTNRITQVQDNLQGQIDTNKANISKNAGDIATLQTQVAGLRTDLTALQQTVSGLQKTVSDLKNDHNTFKSNTNTRLSNIEGVIAKPSWAPASSRLVWGNIDVEYNVDPTNKGLYTHDPANNVVGDMRFQ